MRTPSWSVWLEGSEHGWCRFLGRRLGGRIGGPFQAAEGSARGPAPGEEAARREAGHEDRREAPGDRSAGVARGSVGEVDPHPVALPEAVLRPFHRMMPEPARTSIQRRKQSLMVARHSAPR